MEEKKKVKRWQILFVIIVGIIAALVIVKLYFSEPKFEIANFSMTSETTDYEYIDNYTSYTGEGIVTTNEKKGTYLVVMKVTLMSGGSEDSEQEYCQMILIHNGKGMFSTYDSGDIGKITKPQYNFEIIGSIKF